METMEASNQFEFGICNDCCSRLTPGSTLRTRKSTIFKGGNIYIMCEKCKQIFLYNIQRGLLMDLDMYKDDKRVIDEINEFFEELGENLEVLVEDTEEVDDLLEETEHVCCGNCDSCIGCSDAEEVLPFEEAEPVQQEMVPEFIAPDLSYKILALNTRTGETTILEVNELEQLEGSFIEANMFYELNPLVVEKVVSYKFSKKQ